MNEIDYIGFDIHKKTISYCVKQSDGKILEEEVVAANRPALEEWAEKRERGWIGAMEATLFTGWVYDTLKPYVLLTLLPLGGTGDLCLSLTRTYHECP